MASTLLLAACGGENATPAAAKASTPPELPRHELIFSRHSDAARRDYDVWRVCPDGTQLASLVVAPGHQFQSTLSPDGAELVYASKVDDAWDLFRRPLGRGETVNLTNHPSDDTSPSWSPDGSRLAFFSNRDAEKPELYVLDLEIEGAAPRRLTDNASHEGGGGWSPDGSSILVTRFFPADEEAGTDSSGEILAIDSTTGAETRLTDLGGYNGGPVYSPDGATIAFHRSTEEASEIWLMDADGTNPRPITDTPVIDEYSPAWSPDGRWLAISSGTGHDGMGTFDLWLLSADGAHRHLVSAAPNTEAWQVFRPGAHRCR